MYIVNQRPVTCIQWFAVIALSFQCLSFQVWMQLCIAIHVYECDREMDKDSENDIYGLFCMLGSKPENNVSECNTSDHLLKSDLHLGF